MSSEPQLEQTADGPVIVMPADADGAVQRLTVQEGHKWLEDNAGGECGDLPPCLWCQVNELLIGIR